MTHSGLGGGEDDEEGEVEGLDEAAEGVDGDEDEGVALEEGVVEIEHGAEQRHRVRHRLELLRRPLPPYSVECGSANIHAPLPLHTDIYMYICTPALVLALLN